MSIASMTGFARITGELHTELNNISWMLEMKSVNGKSLDIKTKLPAGYDDLSLEFKKIASKYLQRGSVSIYAEIKKMQNGQKLQINENLLNALINQAAKIYDENKNYVEKPSAGEFLRMSGVVENIETVDEQGENKVRELILDDFEKLCAKLKNDRQEEGVKIGRALAEILQKIKKCADEVTKIADAIPVKVKEKLEQQIEQWVSLDKVDEERLAQEVVFFVNKADIREEADRLQAHIRTAEELLQSSEAVGRRLDFLCQELNREANTTCSKSTDAELTNCGMELKTLIEQFREQIQNIE